MNGSDLPNGNSNSSPLHANTRGRVIKASERKAMLKERAEKVKKIDSIVEELKSHPVCKEWDGARLLSCADMIVTRGLGSALEWFATKERERDENRNSRGPSLSK